MTKQIQKDVFSSPESAEMESAYKEFFKQKLTPLKESMKVRLDSEKLRRTKSLYAALQYFLLAI